MMHARHAMRHHQYTVAPSKKAGAKSSEFDRGDVEMYSSDAGHTLHTQSHKSERCGGKRLPIGCFPDELWHTPLVVLTDALDKQKLHRGPMCQDT